MERSESVNRKNRSLELILVIVVVAVTLSVASQNAAEPASSPTPRPIIASTPVPSIQASPVIVPHDPTEPLSDELVALPGKSPPELTEQYKVKFETSSGDFFVTVYPQAAPNAAERFKTLVEKEFYDDISVSRVVPNFVAQFGINPEMAEWKDKHFDDDPALFQHLPGTIAFAKARPNTNSTQVFINFANNNQLAAPSMNFTVFGIVEGMETVQAFKEVGRSGTGLDQARLWTDKNYLDSLKVKPTMIHKAVLVE